MAGPISNISESNRSEITKNIQTTFLDVEEKVNDEKSAWHYFQRSENKKLGKCKIQMCQKILKTEGGSTSGLITHLRTMHHIDLRKKKIENDPKQAEEGKIKTTTMYDNIVTDIKTTFVLYLLLEYDPHRIKAKTNAINSYFLPKEKKKLEEVVAEMVALDGMPFRVFETSDELRESLKSRGFNIPKTAKSFKQMTIKFSKKIRCQQKSEIKILVANGERFCTTFDEWTSVRNRRYLSLILHGRDSRIWNLGLVRITKAMTTERCLELVKKRLKQFGLTYEEHILSV